MEISQYFNVKISSPKEAKEQVSIDATKYIDDGCTLIDEDGLIKEFTFSMKQSYLMMDILFIGMRVDLIGGDLTENKQLFQGFIKDITPNFNKDGSVSLSIRSFSVEGGKLGIASKDLVFPSKNHPKTWATKELGYSDIITNLAKDADIRVSSENIQVKKDIKASFSKGTVRQNNMTDWAFMQFLAEKIHCTMWTTEKDGTPTLHLVDDGNLVNTLGQYTFYFVNTDRIISEGVYETDKVNSQNKFRERKVSDKELQILSAQIKIDSSQGGSVYRQIQDESGNTKLIRDIEGENGLETWVLDEEKVKALSSKERQKLIGLFMSGKVVWESDEVGVISAKTYFKKITTQESSREGENNNLELEVSGGSLKGDGIDSSGATTENTGSNSYRTVIDSDKLSKLSPEDRSGIIGRIVRGKMTDEDKGYYEVVDSTPKAGKDDAGKSKGQGQNTQAGVDQYTNTTSQTTTRKRKRDAGFSISCTVYGNLGLQPRKSYLLEGLGKYSNTYYLYRVEHSWGSSGYIMKLTFTK